MQIIILSFIQKYILHLSPERNINIKHLLFVNVRNSTQCEMCCRVGKRCGGDRCWRFSKHRQDESPETYGLAVGHVYCAILLDLEEFFSHCWKLFHHDRYDRVKCLPAPDKTQWPFEQLVFVFKAQIIELILWIHPNEINQHFICQINVTCLKHIATFLLSG